MAGRAASDDYGSYGSVPNPVSVNGSGAGPMNVHASAEDFGGQVGRSTENLGGTGQQIGEQFGGMILETATNQAELGYIKASGDLKAKYNQYEGLQAEAMRPQYEAQLQQIHSQYRENLPLGAQKSFDANTIRSMGYQTSEYSSYAANQVKSANLKSHDALMDMAISHTGDLNTVLNDQQFGEQVLAPIIHGGNAIADIHGDTVLANGVNADTGNYSYPDTPEGKAAEARHLALTNSKLASAYLSGAKTVADNQGASAAADWAKKHWDMMPDAAKVQMNQYLAPKMKNEVISGNIVNMNAEIDKGYTDQLVSHVPSGPLDAATADKNSLDVIRKNEGEGYSKDSKGEVINGINSLAFPTEFAEAKKILDTQGQAAANKYSDDFYQKNIIDKYDVKSLPPETQAIVADGLVNHGGGDFGKSLVQAAKDGASPGALIDMRRAEYQRLNDTGKPEYTSSFKGWNARLDNLQSDASGQAVYQNKADFLRAHEEKFVDDKVNAYLQQYPDDYYGSQIQERRARTSIRKQITDEDGALKSDRDLISNAVSGAYTKGKPPATYEELRALPGMAPVLDKTMSQQGQFFGTIDTMIAKASHRDEVTNSANGYDTIQRTLKPEDDKDGIHSTDHLARLLGDNKGTGISWKDFQDAKPAIGLDSTLKDTLSKHMNDIANANGNVDGKGQERAIQWYGQAMSAWKKNQGLGDKGISPSDFAASLGEKNGPPMPSPPSRMQQLSNWAASLTKAKQQPMPTLTDKSQFDALQSGDLYIRNGTQYRKP